MKLKELFKDIPHCQIQGSPEVVITGISANSKLVKPGNLFIAKLGNTYDGRQYIPDAIAAGACAVLTDLFDPSLKQIVQIIHPHAAQVEAALAAEYYQYPDDGLFLVGMTGTSGKTTTSFILKNLLDTFHGPCGLIGTIEYLVGTHCYKATLTTPDVLMNYKLLREMCTYGCQSAVMEVTSHALDQGRVDKLDFDVAIFSNLTLDHLDYHVTMEQYCDAKKRLFDCLDKQTRKKTSPKWAVINQDSPWSQRIVQDSSVQRLTYGIDQQADVRATHIRLERQGTYARLAFQGQTADCFWPFAGRFNIYNCLAAISVLLTRGVPLAAIAEKMAALPPVRGRLEPVKNEKGLKIYVDFAHKPDALLNVLQTLSEMKTGRLLVVFGCGGDRDKTKRPKMAEVCERYADISLVTSDNPRSEDPHAICQDIIKGFHRQDSFLVELDRRAAIQKAIEMACQDDIILIAGKGHEIYQIFAHQTVEFDDVKIVTELCLQ